MYLLRKARNVLLWRLQAYGTASIKKFLWNVQFEGGRWQCLESTAGDCIYPFIYKYLNGGSILDLGCGAGNTGNELAATAYGGYTGIDISDVAIKKARMRSKENHRADKNSFFQSEVLSYVPTQQFDVILYRESLYYIPPKRINGMLDRYAKYLKKDAVFIARLYSIAGKHKNIVEIIESNFEIVEMHLFDEPKAAVIVFR